MARDKPQSAHATGTDEGMCGRGWMFTLMLLWWFGGYGLVVYGVMTDRGPFALLIDWQSALFGGYNAMVGALIGAVFIFFGAPPVPAAAAGSCLSSSGAKIPPMLYPCSASTPRIGAASVRCRSSTSTSLSPRRNHEAGQYSRCCGPICQ